MNAVTAPSAPSPLDEATRRAAAALGMSPAQLQASLKKATLADLPDLLALRRQVLGAQITWDDERYLPWRYRFGRLGVGAGDCWILRRRGELLAMVGTEEMRLELGHVRAEAIRLMDILVRPGCKGKGVGAWLLVAMQEKADVVMCVGSNPESKGLVTRIFTPLQNRRTFIHPLGFDHFMAKRLGQGPLARAASRLAGGAMALLRAATMKRRAAGIVVNPVPGVPGDVGPLIGAASHPLRIDVARSLRHWSWRLSTPRGQFDVWAARRDGRLVGLLITRPDALEPGRVCWTVMDALLEDADKAAVLSALLWTVAKHARRAGAEYLSWTSCRRDLEALMGRLAFAEQSNEYRIMAWSCRNEALRKAGEAGADWSFNELHTDGA